MPQRSVGFLAVLSAPAILSSCVNTAPIIEPLVVTQDEQRARLIAAGSTVAVTTRVRDREGDDVRLSWFASDGQLLSNGLERTSWELGGQAGTYILSLTATDEHGAQSVAQAQVTVGDQFTYEGTVLMPDGTPVAGATVTVNGESTTTAADGSFRLTLSRAAVNRDGFRIDIRKPGVMSVSRSSTSPPGQSSWILANQTTAQRNTNAQFRVADTGSGCRPPYSSLINWSLYADLATPKVQNAQGEYVDANLGHPLADALRYVMGGAHCNIGASISVQANSIVDPSTGAQPATVDVSIGTVDLNSPDSMPGNRGVDGRSYMVSMGAAEINITANGKPMQLKEGSPATLSVPVPARLRCQDPRGETRELECPDVPPEISLLVYDDATGQWKTDGVAKYDRKTQSYVGSMTHLSAYNMDFVKTNPGCLRLDSQAISGEFSIDVVVPNTANLDPTYINRDVPNPPGDQLHAFFNLPPNTDVGIIAMHKIANPACPAQPDVTPIGIFVGQTGNGVTGGFPLGSLDAPYNECGPWTTLSNLASSIQIVRNGAGIPVGRHSAAFYALVDAATGEKYPVDGSNTCNFHLSNSPSCSLMGIVDPGSTRMRVASASPNRMSGTTFGGPDSTVLNVADEITVNVRLNGIGARSGGIVPEDAPGGANQAQVQINNIRVDVPPGLDMTLIGTPLIKDLVYHVDYTNILTTEPEIGLSGVASVTFYSPGDAAIPATDITLNTAMYAPSGQPPKYVLRDLEFTNGCSPPVTGQPGPGTSSFQFLFDPGSTVTAINDNVAAALGLSLGPGGTPTGTDDCFAAGDKKGYQLNRLRIAGENGSYQVDSPVVCWDGNRATGSAFGRPIDALFGSNLFDAVEIVVDGTNGKVGIIQ